MSYATNPDRPLAGAERLAQRRGSRRQLCTESERPGGNQMTILSAGQAAAACLAVATAWHVQLITPGNPRCGCEPGPVSGQC
jgi:hypothetical protein